MSLKIPGTDGHQLLCLSSVNQKKVSDISNNVMVEVVVEMEVAIVLLVVVVVNQKKQRDICYQDEISLILNIPRCRVVD